MTGDRGRAAGGGAGEPRFVVPFLRHGGFVGREEDLAALHALLQDEGSVVGVLPVAASGMGGIGKTQLAVEYAYRYAGAYPGGVYWVNAARDVLAELAGLAERVGLREDNAPESLRQQRLALAFAGFLEGHPGALVIFDNVEDPLSLRDPGLAVVPVGLCCRLLFTTRRRERAWGFASFEVRVLPEDFALRLLLASEVRCGVLAREGAGEGGGAAEIEVGRGICRVLGCLPLAIVLAAAFLGKSPRVSLGDYLGRLKRDGGLAAVDEAGRKVDPRSLGTRHDAAVEATLGAQWEAVGSEEARRVLMAATLLGEAAQVSRGTLSLLTGLSDVAADGYVAPLEEALDELAGWSLVEELGEREIRIHRLVREFAALRIVELKAFKAECAGNLGEGLWELGRLSDEVAARGVDALLGDLRMGVRLSREAEVDGGWIERLVRVLDREAHCLRRWRAGERPEFLLQQVRNRCFELREEDGCGVAARVLAARGMGYLRERVRSERESEALVRTLEGHADWVRCAVVTENGRWAVSASNDKTVKVWDLGTGQLVRTLEGHRYVVTGVAVTADGRWAVSASRDATLKVWDIGSGQLVHTLEGHRDVVSGVAVTADGRWAVSASADQTLKVWDLGTGQLVRTLEGHTRYVTGVAVTADGRWAVSASYDKTLKVWDVGIGQLIHTLEGHTNWVYGVAVTADGCWAVSASSDKTLKLWDLGSGQLIRTLEGHMRWVYGVAVTADGRWAVSASEDKTLKVWDLGNGKQVRTLEGHTHGVRSAAVTADGHWAMSASADKTLKVWNLESWQLARTFEGHTDAVTGAAVTADGRWAVSASADETLKVWDLSSGQLLRTLEGHMKGVTGVAVTADGRWAISTSYDQTLKVWDLGTGRLVSTLAGHTDWMRGVAVTANGRWAVSASYDKTLNVWDLGTGRLVRTLEGHTDGVTGVTVTANGRRIVSASNDKTLKVWDLGTGQLVRTLSGHMGWVTGVAVTANGRGIVSASWDQTLKVWDFGSEQLVRTLEGHTNGVTGVAVTADGRWAVSTSYDKTLRVWDLTTGLPVALLETHAPLHCCTFVSDHLILVGDAAGTLHFLDWHRPGTLPSATTSPPTPPKRPHPPQALPPAPPPPRPWPTKLTGPDLHELAEALLRAYPTRSALAQMLRFSLDKNLDALTPERSSLRDTLFQLLTTANAEGWIHPLIDAALAHTPGSPELRALADKRRSD